MYPLINQIHTYDILVTVGSILGILTIILLTLKETKNIKLALGVSLSVIPMVLLGGFVGRLLLRVSKWDFAGINGFINKLGEYNGVHFIGTILVFVIFVPLIYKKIIKNKTIGYKIPQILSFYLIIQHIFNRLACLCEGCCYGKAYSGLGAITFTQGYGFNLGVNYSVFPTAVFELICMLILMILIIILYKKELMVFETTIVGLGSIIFVSEIFMEQRGKMLFMGLSSVQLTAIVVILIGVVMVIKKREIKRKCSNLPTV